MRVLRIKKDDGALKPSSAGEQMLRCVKEGKRAGKGLRCRVE